MYKYKIGDIVTIKTRELIENLKSGRNVFSGFYLKDGLFFNEAMFKFCEKKYCIKELSQTGSGVKTYFLKPIANSLDDYLEISSWTWTEMCFESTNKQMEFDF